MSGASVLVVGPAPHNQPDAQTLAAADVVVTTKHPSDSASHKPSVVYVTDATGRLESERLEQSLRHNRDLLVVVRPSWLADPRSTLFAPDRVRVMQCEDSSTYLGTHFAIQRIIYDLVGFGARSITLAGVDFFLTPDPYRMGYANDDSSIYSSRGLQPARSIAPHDHLSDFVFTKDLCELGVIEAADNVHQFLTLAPDIYLERLSEICGAGADSTGRPI